jgi:hypothetical protein
MSTGTVFEFSYMFYRGLTRNQFDEKCEKLKKIYNNIIKLSDITLTTETI